MPLSTRVQLALAATYTKAAGLATGTVPIDYSRRLDLDTGVGAAQADLVYSATRTLAASGTENLDLAGALVDGFGALLNFARIKTVLIAATAGNTNDVVVTRPAANGVPLFLAAGDGLVVRPGGLFLWSASDAVGVPVTAGTADLLTVANGGAGTSVTYDVVIVGASA